MALEHSNKNKHNPIQAYPNQKMNKCKPVSPNGLACPTAGVYLALPSKEMNQKFLHYILQVHEKLSEAVLPSFGQSKTTLLRSICLKKNMLQLSPRSVG